MNIIICDFNELISELLQTDSFRKALSLTKNTYTINEMPPTACVRARKPSDILSVTAFPTRIVSFDNRLVSSPADV